MRQAFRNRLLSKTYVQYVTIHWGQIYMRWPVGTVITPCVYIPGCDAQILVRCVAQLFDDCSDLSQSLYQRRADYWLCSCSCTCSCVANIFTKSSFLFFCYVSYFFNILTIFSPLYLYVLAI